MSGAPNAAHHNIVDDQWRAARNQKNFSLQHAQRALEACGVCLDLLRGYGGVDLERHRAHCLTDGEARPESRAAIHRVHGNQVTVVIDHGDGGPAFSAFTRATAASTMILASSKGSETGTSIRGRAAN